MVIRMDSEPVRNESWSLLGSITFKGPFEGCLFICCDADCAKAIVTNMLGFDTDEKPNQEDINDALGEVVNMVMGGVKKRLDGELGKTIPSIPTVVSGRQLQSDLGLGATKFSIEVNIDSQYTAMLSLSYRKTL